MAGDSSFDAWLTRLRARDDRATTEVFRRYTERLVALARHQLHGRLAGKVDPEDVVQSVWGSFFARHAGGQFDLDDGDGLWSLLVVLTLRKCDRRIRYFLRKCRDARLEVPAQTGDSNGQWQAVDDQPTPAEAAMLAETVQHVMAGLKARHRPILTLTLQGYNPSEISVQTGQSERTIFRVLNGVRKMIATFHKDSSEG
jgi:RNA polymerase sigma-70 factor (ECF subfamily)